MADVVRTSGMRGWVRGAVCSTALIAMASFGGCGSATMQQCSGTNPGSHEQCLVSSDPGVAVGTAAVASGLWVVGKGCNVNGCLPPLRCNGQNGLCERIPCDEGNECPSGYACDLDDHTCH